MKYTKSEWIQIVVLLVIIEIGKNWMQKRELKKQRKFYEKVITREVEKRVKAEEKANFTNLYNKYEREKKSNENIHHGRKW